MSSVLTSSTAVLSCDNKKNLNYATNIYVASLCNDDAWPLMEESKTMAEEVFVQSNASAQRVGCQATDTDQLSEVFSQKVIFFCSSLEPKLTSYPQIRHSHSLWCGNLKNAVFQSIQDCGHQA